MHLLQLSLLMSLQLKLLHTMHLHLFQLSLLMSPQLKLLHTMHLLQSSHLMSLQLKQLLMFHHNQLRHALKKLHQSPQLPQVQNMLLLLLIFTKLLLLKARKLLCQYTHLLPHQPHFLLPSWLLSLLHSFK